VDIVLVTAGVACLIAAVAGVAIKAMNVEIGQIASLRRQFLLGLLGVVFLGAGIIVREGSGTSEGSDTTTEDEQPAQTSSLIPFEDDFSTTDYKWRGGVYLEEEEAYKISAERGNVGDAAVASPENASTLANLRITVDAHRTGGTAQHRYGYGIFCRGDGETRFYAFNVWENQATLAKRISATTDPIALADPSPDVQSAVTGDSWKELEATCTSTTVNGEFVVDLKFSVDGEMILQATDPTDCRKPCGSPLSQGSFGLRVTLGAKGEPEDRLDVTFDNFQVRED
jgi:hypothetical protein